MLNLLNSSPGWAAARHRAAQRWTAVRSAVLRWPRAASKDACSASRNAWISMKIANCRAPVAACMAFAVAYRALTTTGRLQPPAGRLQLPAGRLQLSAERLLHRARHLPQPVPRQQPAGRLQPQGVCRYLLGVCSCLQGYLQGARMAPATACRATCRVPSERLQAALALANLL